MIEFSQSLVLHRDLGPAMVRPEVIDFSQSLTSVDGMNAEQSEPGATADTPQHPARNRDDPTARVAHAIERRDATDAEAKALASSVRIRILRLCLDDELSNREIAEALDLNPATALHHVRMLVDTGFLEAQEPRRGRRGAREIPYRATGRSWFIDAGDITDPMIEAFAAEFSAAPYPERSMSRMAAMLTPAEVVEFQQRLEDLLEDFRSRRSQDGARQWALFVAMHPSAAPDEGAS